MLILRFLNMKNIELVHDMRNEILQLKDLGRMPNESINDTESIDELVNTYDALLDHLMKLWCWYKSFLKMLFMICSGVY